MNEWKDSRDVNGIAQREYLLAHVPQPHHLGVEAVRLCLASLLLRSSIADLPCCDALYYSPRGGLRRYKKL